MMATGQEKRFKSTASPHEDCILLEWMFLLYSPKYHYLASTQ